MRLFTHLFLLIAAAAHADGDELFRRMQGKWVGTGERTFVSSGRKVRIQAQVESRVRGDRLFSENRVTETDGAGLKRTYERSYWIRPAGGARYQFGIGSQVLFEGYLEDQVLFATQEVQGYQIRSSTFISEESSEYFETVVRGPSEISRASIRYVRTP